MSDDTLLRQVLAAGFTLAPEPSRGGWSLGKVVNGQFHWVAHCETLDDAVTSLAAHVASLQRPPNTRSQSRVVADQCKILAEELKGHVGTAREAFAVRELHAEIDRLESMAAARPQLIEAAKRTVVDFYRGDGHLHGAIQALDNELKKVRP